MVSFYYCPLIKRWYGYGGALDLVTWDGNGEEVRLCLHLCLLCDAVAYGGIWSFLWVLKRCSSFK